MFRPDIVCCPSSAATVALRSAVPLRWLSGMLAGFVLTDHTGDNWTLQGHEGRTGAATIFIKICEGLYAALRCHGGATIQIGLLWDEFDEGQHSDILVFLYSGWISLLSP